MNNGKKPRKRARTLGAAAGLLLLPGVLGGWSTCGPSLNVDASFDLWCGESLCFWSVDSGTVRRVSTWHPQDYGVELVGDPAVISQLIEKRVGCMSFDTLAEVDPNASVFLGLDFEDDGTEEYAAPVPGNDWSAVSYLITPPSWYSKVRFSLRKTGPGRAVLAHIRISEGSDCSAAPLPLSGRPLGAGCENSSQCAGGLCAPGGFPYHNADDLSFACGECSADADCSGASCGLEPDQYGLHAACKEAGRHLLGERCLYDGECSSGICCGQVCSACCEESQCADGESCTLSTHPVEGDPFWMPRPFQCAPGEGRGAAGELCLRDQDCASGSCAGRGELRLCWYDGRRCQGDDDCRLSWMAKPEDYFCATLGVDDGRCQ